MMKIANFEFRIANLKSVLPKFAIRNSKFAMIPASLVILLSQIPLLAKCPAPDGTTVVIRAPIGNLHVDTTGRDSVDVQVNTNMVQIQETCGKEIGLTSNTPNASQILGAVDWKILVPRAVDLDIVAYAGSITVGDLDGNIILRTTGGSITVGQIKGRAAMIAQGGIIKSGNIGGDAELRGRSIDVGDITGNAELQTVGAIRTGAISGRVTADATGGTIFIKEARGEVQVSTKAGDISIGDAARINAKSGGGNILSRRVRGPFQGHTDSGDIRLDSAAAWVEGSTGSGNIVVRLVPDNIDGDLHVNLEAGVGDVTIYLPQRMKATVEATVERPAFSAQHIISDFPMSAMAPAPTRPRGLVPNRFYAATRSQSVVNGGGNRINLHTSLGKIEIRRQ